MFNFNDIVPEVKGIEFGGNNLSPTKEKIFNKILGESPENYIYDYNLNAFINNVLPEKENSFLLKALNKTADIPQEKSNSPLNFWKILSNPSIIPNETQTLTKAFLDKEIPYIPNFYRQSYSPINTVEELDFFPKSIKNVDIKNEFDAISNNNRVSTGIYASPEWANHQGYYGNNFAYMNLDPNRIFIVSPEIYSKYYRGVDWNQDKQKLLSDIGVDGLMSIKYGKNDYLNPNKDWFEDEVWLTNPNSIRDYKSFETLPLGGGKRMETNYFVPIEKEYEYNQLLDVMKEWRRLGMELGIDNWWDEGNFFRLNSMQKWLNQNTLPNMLKKQ